MTVSHCELVVSAVSRGGWALYISLLMGIGRSPIFNECRETQCKRCTNDYINFLATLGSVNLRLIVELY